MRPTGMWEAPMTHRDVGNAGGRRERPRPGAWSACGCRTRSALKSPRTDRFSPSLTALHAAGIHCAQPPFRNPRRVTQSTAEAAAIQPAPADFAAVQALVAPQMQRVDALIRRRLASDVVLVNQIAEHGRSPDLVSRVAAFTRTLIDAVKN